MKLTPFRWPRTRSRERLVREMEDRLDDLDGDFRESLQVKYWRENDRALLAGTLLLIEASARADGSSCDDARYALERIRTTCEDDVEKGSRFPCLLEEFSWDPPLLMIRAPSNFPDR